MREREASEISALAAQVRRLQARLARLHNAGKGFNRSNLSDAAVALAEAAQSLDRSRFTFEIEEAPACDSPK